MQAVCKTFVFIYVRYVQVSLRRTHTPTEIGPNYRFSSARKATRLCESMLLLKVINPSGAGAGMIQGNEVSTSKERHPSKLILIKGIIRSY